MIKSYNRSFFAIAFAGTLFLNANAQTTRCASHEWLERQLQQDPNAQSILDAQNAAADAFAASHPSGVHNRAVVTIPVIFHVLYKTAAQNISTTRLLEQIDVLNHDYRATNSDIGSVPSVWTNLIGDCEVEFCLAKRDPSGNWTDGIERVATTVTSFSDVSENAKHASQGGADAWDHNAYLNIWVCNLGGGLLGYSSLPGLGAANEDGVVLHFNYVGLTGALSPYNKGRTATHEIGHFMGLFHIWGDESGCAGNDYVSDTPNQGPENYGCPTFPHTDNCQGSSPGVMFMNYMDYTDDACMYFFTAGQKTRMWTYLTSTRAALTASNACTPTGIAEGILAGEFNVAPSPSTDGKFTIRFANKDLKDLDIVVYNVIGEAIYRRHLDAINDTEYDLDLTGNDPGVYFLEIANAKDKAVRKIMIQ